MVEHAISHGSLEKKGDGNRDVRDSTDMGVDAAMVLRSATFWVACCQLMLAS